MSVFMVNVGTDLFGTKRNIKLDFPRTPTMAEFINAVESQYDIEMRACRPAGYPDVPFKVQTFQLYDDVLQRWVDLYSSAQLTAGCTVYCFQPESIWHSDSQDIIPGAKDTVTWTTPTGSPRRARLAADAGVAPSLSEKLRSVFYECDTGNKGYVLYNDLRAAFSKCDMDFTYATVGELFTAADANQSGHITYDEWVAFAIKFPAIIDALFFRSRDVKVDQIVASGAASVVADEHAKMARQAELRAMYERQLSAAAQPPPPPSAQVQELEAALNQQKAAATAAAKLQAQLQDDFDAKNTAAMQAEKRLLELRGQLEAQRYAASSETQRAVDAAATVEAARAALQAEAAKQAEMQAHLERLKKQTAEAEARAAAQAAEIARQQAEAAAKAEEEARAASARALEMQAIEAARREEEAKRAAEYERAKREADEARAAKELAELREREAWDKMHYNPNSPPRF